MVHRGSCCTNRLTALHSPADLPSYAVVDIARPSGLGADHVMKALFDTMERHGMRILNNGKAHLRNLIVRHQGGLDTDSVSLCFGALEVRPDVVFSRFRVNR